MSRSQDERQPVREGVLNNTRSGISAMSVTSMEKEKLETQLTAKINSGSEHSGYRTVDLIKPNKSLSNSMPHVSVGSAPMPPMPPLQAPSLTSILPGPVHPIIPPVLSHGPLARAGALSAQIPLMGRAAAAIAPPRASIAVPPLRAAPALKSTSNPNQIPLPSKGTSIFSPIASNSRIASSSSPASVISRTSDHIKAMDTKITYIQTGVHNSNSSSSSSSLPPTGTATVQVIESGTAAHAHIASLQPSKSFSVVPNQNILKIGSQNAQQSQSSSMANPASIVSTYRVAPPPNNITFSKVIPQPILIPSTTSGTLSSTMPDTQDHQRIISTSNSSIGLLSPAVSSSHHSAFSSHLHYASGLSVHGSTSQLHPPFSSNADSKSDKLKPGNPSLQHAIGSYFPIDGFPRFAPNSPFHPYVRAQPGATVYSPFPMFVDGAHAFATAPLPIPGISSTTRDSHHHTTSGESSPVMNSSYSVHNMPNLQPSSFQSNNSSSPRPGPGILRKRTADGYPAHGLDRIASPSKQDIRAEVRQDSKPDVRPSSGQSLPSSRQESPRLLCDEKGTYNDIIVADSSLLPSNNVPLPSNTEIKREPNTSPLSANAYQKSFANQSLSITSHSSSSTPEASPRKKPRKQNVITTEDKFSSKVSMEEEETEIDNKIKDKRKDSKVDSHIIRIQKPAAKVKSEENSEEVKEPEIPEPDEYMKYYMFINKRKSSALGDYRINSKAAHHHFYRYSDVRSKDEKKPLDLINFKRISQNISGWRIFHMSSQMDDLCSLENDVCSKLYEFQRELPRPSKQYMLTAMCHDLQNGKRFASIDEQLRVLHELIQGNIQRCQLSMEQLDEAKQTMLKVIDHKPKILEIVKRHKHKRSSKKKTLPSY